MSLSQSGILLPVPGHARYLEYRRNAGVPPEEVLAAISEFKIDESLVIGIGSGLVSGTGRSVDGLRPFPALSASGIEIPSTQADLWIWQRGQDRGDIQTAGRSLQQHLAPLATLCTNVDGFKYRDGRDLTGYVDGTENPDGEDAVEAAITGDGSSFAAVQLWAHDMAHFARYSESETDDMIGRRLSDNEEFDDSPPSAHVKRTAQESFDPEAFVVRRSMPWTAGSAEGLMFVAFGATLDSFEVQLRRMIGEEDGIQDGLFNFSRPLSGSYFWCPPVRGGKLDLSAISA